MAAVTEARVAEMIAEVQQSMSNDLRAEFAATQKAAESRLLEVQTEMSKDIKKEFMDTQEQGSIRMLDIQTSMSVDLRNEFAKTQADYAARLENLASGIDAAIRTKFAEADKAFNDAIEAERAAYTATVEELTTSWQLVHNGKLNEVADAMKNLEKIQTSHVALSADYVEHKKTAIEAFTNHWGLLQQLMRDAPLNNGDNRGAPRASKSLEVRVPDPRNWVLDVLKDGDWEWYAWRQAFELQVRSVWGDLEKVFIDLRGLQVPMDEELYQDKLIEHSVVPQGLTPLPSALDMYLISYTWFCIPTREQMPASCSKKVLNGAALKGIDFLMPHTTPCASMPNNNWSSACSASPAGRSRA